MNEVNLSVFLDPAVTNLANAYKRHPLLLEELLGYYPTESLDTIVEYLVKDFVNFLVDESQAVYKLCYDMYVEQYFEQHEYRQIYRVYYGHGFIDYLREAADDILTILMGQLEPYVGDETVYISFIDLFAGVLSVNLRKRKC